MRDPRVTAGTSFEYAVNDGVTDSANARVFLAIQPPNSPPVFTSRPPTAIQAEGVTSTVVYQATAVDPDAGDTITYSLKHQHQRTVRASATWNQSRDGRGLDRAVDLLRRLHWRVTLTATDSQGASATQTFVLRHEARARVAVPNVVGRPCSPPRRR